MKTKNILLLATVIVLIVSIALPSSVFASSDVNFTQDLVLDDDDPNEISVTVAASLDNPGDITMLAYHSDSALTAVPSPIDENEIMYVNQVHVTAENLTTEKTFILRNGVQSGYVTVFLGGTDVAQYKYASVQIMAAPPALAYSASNTYTAGDDVVIEFTDDADWRSAVTAVEVDDVALAAADYAFAAGTLTISNLAVGTYNKVEVMASGYSDAVLASAITIAAAAASPVEPEDVTVMTRNNVYNNTGYKLVKIEATGIDYTAKSVVVDGQPLIYSMDKGAFYGIVNASDATSESVAQSVEISDTPSATFYYGKVNNPANPRNATTGKITAMDVAAAKKIILKTSTPTVASFLAADVHAAEPDGNITALDVADLKKNALNGTALPILGN